MTRTEVIEIAKKYFLMSETQSEKYIQKFLLSQNPQAKPEDNIRLQHILSVVDKYFEPFLDITDDKIKRKVGRLVFSTLNYKSFGDEPTKETKNRLDCLFGQIVNKKINPFKVIYGSVLTDGNLKVDFENESREYDKNRDFDSIYNSVKNTLKIDDNETVALFEKCSSLISKVSAERVPKIFDCLKSLYVGTADYNVRLFDENEVVEILKINSSLFGNSRHKMWGALRYLERKAEKQLGENLLPLHANKHLNFLLNKRQLLRSWLKNNSSLLNINEEKMIAKEKFLKTELLDSVHPTYRQSLMRGISKIFENSTNLSYISGKISYTDLRVNARKNLQLLESFASPLVLEKYLPRNPYVLAMNRHDLAVLFEKISENDANRSKLIDNFFAYGKALFANKTEFNPDEIFEKLVSSKVKIDLDVENLTGQDCLLNFAEIFMDGDQSIVCEIDELRKKKQDREMRGEKTLRKAIRQVGVDVDEVIAFVVADDVNKTLKKNLVTALANDVKHLNEKRFELANTDDFQTLRNIELENSQKIENVLNKLRDIYEQKRYHVGKRYQESDQLFEKMMDYLGNIFDDKEAICTIFSKEIAKHYLTLIEENFDVSQNKQLSIFEDDLIVKNADEDLIEPLNELSTEIEKSQNAHEVKKVVFEKSNN